MRKNTARHWLHASLDLLPVLLIPVFMIYSHRHTIDSSSITITENKVVDFNQEIENGNFENQTGFVGYNSNRVIENNQIKVEYTNSGGYWGKAGLNFESQHIYLFKIQVQSLNSSSTKRVSLYYGANVLEYNFGTFNLGFNTYRYQSQIDNNNIQIYYYGTPNATDTFTNFQMFDLTSMFGAGNEPTNSEFNSYFPEVYYDYTLSESALINNYSSSTYNDTDIMSQFTYQMYNAVDKYFNMGNVFNMNNVYDWFNLNIFGGNAPISFYIVWNIVLYEFIMDLLFLLYGLFMWFIDICKHLMDKPFRSIK